MDQPAPATMNSNLIFETFYVTFPFKCADVHVAYFRVGIHLPTRTEIFLRATLLSYYYV